MAATRPVSIFQWTQLARRNAGYPHVVTLALAYAPRALPSTEYLYERVRALQERFPALCARLADADGDDARWVEGAAWPADAIVREEPLPADADPDGLLPVLEADLHWMEREDIVDRPLWQATRYVGARSAFLALSVSHVLNDGRGAFNLLTFLLAPSFDAHPREPFGAPWAEDVVDLVPAAPVQLAHTPAPWPGGRLRRPPADCAVAFVLANLEPELVAALKAAGKARGVPTLDPLLRTAGVLALHSVLDADVHLQAMYAYSFRHEHPGVSAVAGSFHVPLVAFHAPAPADRFWALAREGAAHAQSADAHALGRHLVGNTVHLPRPLAAHYAGVWAGPAPYRASVAFSNMAHCALPPGARDLAWVQTTGINFPALCAELVGHERGCRITVGWREGSVLERREVELFVQRWTAILEKVAAGPAEDWTVETLMLNVP
jgi:hypothetical protein